jgi:hypothetical protein
MRRSGSPILEVDLSAIAVGDRVTSSRENRVTVVLPLVVVVDVFVSRFLFPRLIGPSVRSQIY